MTRWLQAVALSLRCSITTTFWHLPHWRSWLEAIAEHADVDYLYSDEDKLDPNGNYCDLFRKPDWSPERLRHQNVHMSPFSSPLFGGAEHRRLSRRLRRVAGPRSRSTRFGARAPDRSRAQSPLPLAHTYPARAQCRGREAICMGSREKGGTGTPRSRGDRAAPPNSDGILGSTGYDGLSILRRL